MSQTIVVDNQWLTPEMMMDGLGLAETTPGPLILVTEFVGIVSAALSNEDKYHSRLIGRQCHNLGNICSYFLYIFLGAPTWTG